MATNVNAIEKSIRELNQLVESPEISEEMISEIKSDLDKLHKALDYYDWLNRLVDTLESHEIFNYVPKKPPIT